MQWIKEKYFSVLTKARHYVQSFFDFNDMVEMTKIVHKGVSLRSVLMENHLTIRNKFFFPITILSIKTKVFNNKDQMIGTMKYEIPRKIKGKMEEILVLETHYSHITALFDVARFFFTEKIEINVRGESKVKIFFWAFTIPIRDKMYIHRDMVEMTPPKERNILHKEKPVTEPLPQHEEIIQPIESVPLETLETIEKEIQDEPVTVADIQPEKSLSEETTSELIETVPEPEQSSDTTESP